MPRSIELGFMVFLAPGHAAAGAVWCVKSRTRGPRRQGNPRLRAPVPTSAGGNVDPCRNQKNSTLTPFSIPFLI